MLDCQRKMKWKESREAALS